MPVLQLVLQCAAFNYCICSLSVIGAVLASFMQLRLENVLRCRRLRFHVSLRRRRVVCDGRVINSARSQSIVQTNAPSVGFGVNGGQKYWSVVVVTVPPKRLRSIGDLSSFASSSASSFRIHLDHSRSFEHCNRWQQHDQHVDSIALRCCPCLLLCYYS